MLNSERWRRHPILRKVNWFKDQPERLTLSEEVRKLLKQKKIAESKESNEAKASEWEDVQKKTPKRRKRKERAD